MATESEIDRILTELADLVEGDTLDEFQATALLQAQTILQSLRSQAGESEAVLKWVPVYAGSIDLKAETALGGYTMSFDAPTAGGAVNLWMAGADVDTFQVFDTRKEAVAAAEADYLARSLARPAPIEITEDALNEAVTAELLAEHSGCGHGVQVEQVTAKLAPGDAVYVVRGKLGQALLLPKSNRIETLYRVPALQGEKK